MNVLGELKPSVYCRRYNSLPEIETAYRRFARLNDRKAVLFGALKIIRQHGANHYLGITLVHRHFRCDRRRIFVERTHRPRVEAHPALYVTEPEKISDASKRIVPHRFKLGKDGSIEPLEFSTDVSAISAYHTLVDDNALRQDLANYLKHRSATKILGLGIFTKTRTTANARRVFLEDTLENKSVVHEVGFSRKDIIKKTIPTLWTADTSFCCSVGCKYYEKDGYCGHGSGKHRDICIC